MFNKDIISVLKSDVIGLIVLFIFIFVLGGTKAFKDLNWITIIGIFIFNFFYTLYELKKNPE